MFFAGRCGRFQAGHAGRFFFLARDVVLSGGWSIAAGWDDCVPHRGGAYKMGSDERPLSILCRPFLVVVFIVRMSDLSVLDDIINTHTRYVPLSGCTSTVLCSVPFDVLKMIILLCMISFRRSNGIEGECRPVRGSVSISLERRDVTDCSGCVCLR